MKFETIDGGIAQALSESNCGLRAKDSTRYLNESSSEILKALLQNGAVLFKGLHKLHDPVEFENLIESIGLKTRGYVGGSSPRGVIKGKVMEATRTPEDWSIILHQEQAYIIDAPEVIAFYCETPAEGGLGESVLGDMRSLTDKVDPKIYAELKARGIRLRRPLPSSGRVELKPGVKKSWEEALAVPSKAEAEQVCRSRGWDFQWSGEDLVLWQDIIQPERAHPISQKAMWFNQVHFWGAAPMMEWALIDGRLDDWNELKRARDQNPELLEAMCFGDGEILPDDLSLELFETVRQQEMDFRLESGDLLLVDNVQFAHGRRAFSGLRKINVTLADWQQPVQFEKESI